MRETERKKVLFVVHREQIAKQAYRSFQRVFGTTRTYPVYNAQWKETGEWRQSYHAYPEPGFRFMGWKDESGNILSREETWVDDYGTSRVLYACFEKE